MDAHDRERRANFIVCQPRTSEEMMTRSSGHFLVGNEANGLAVGAGVFSFLEMAAKAACSSDVSG